MAAGLESMPAPTQPSPGGAGAGFNPPKPQELAPCFPQLEILDVLGQGGMGAVYKARHKGLDRLVAVKILPPEASRHPAFAERFTREARALARLNHPNIVAVYDFGKAAYDVGDADGLYYFIMEYVDGVNLRQTLRNGGLSPQDALVIVPQVCDALQFAHDEGIVHRDIKPENILIDRRGRVKIADFGLAKLLGQNDAEHSLTQTHQVMGTLRYMAPEQMEGARTVDHRADIYSLGVVFYELLTGELPLGRFAPPSRKVQVDVRLDEVVLRTLEKEPEQRYQHASEVKSELECIRQAESRGQPYVASVHALPRQEHVSLSPETGGLKSKGNTIDTAALPPPRLLGVVATVNLMAAVGIMMVATAHEIEPLPKNIDAVYRFYQTVAPWLDYLTGVLLFAGSLGVYQRRWWGRRLTLAAIVLSAVTFVLYMPIIVRYELPALYADMVKFSAEEGMPSAQQEWFAWTFLTGLFLVIYSVGLSMTVFNLVYFNRPNVRAALGDSGPADEQPPFTWPKEQTLAMRWMALPALVRTLVNIALALGYGACYILFFSFHVSSTKSAEGRVGHFQLGMPSPWFTYDTAPSSFEWRIDLLSWSVLAAVVGLCLLALARRLELWEKGRAHSMVLHYAIWGISVGVALAIGMTSSALSKLS
jgi:tRNA A-37 threonylcarbamoyl transferase component Bud32